MLLDRVLSLAFAHYSASPLRTHFGFAAPSFLICSAVWSKSLPGWADSRAGADLYWRSAVRSLLTAKIRSIWPQSIRRAADLKSGLGHPAFTHQGLCRGSERTWFRSPCSAEKCLRKVFCYQGCPSDLYGGPRKYQGAASRLPLMVKEGLSGRPEVPSI